MQQKRWIMNPFQPARTTAISTKADEELIDLSEDSFLEMNFNTRKLVHFLGVSSNTVPTHFLRGIKSTYAILSYKCEAGFSAMVEIKANFEINCNSQILYA